MKIITLLSIFVVAVAYPRSADELARNIISSQPISIYNLFDESDEELRKGVESNYKLRLISFMNSDEVSEEIRISFALQILNPTLTQTTNEYLSSDEYAEKKKDSEILIERLVEIQKSKMHNQTVDTTATNAAVVSP